MLRSGTGILVCGPPRSGASALAGALRACGVVLRETRSADGDNPKGYLETAEVTDLHEAFLHQLGIDGLSIEPLPLDWEAREAADKARIQIASFAEREFDGADIWAVKDPRLCRLAPLWKGALPEVKVRPIIVVRHPLEMAASMQKTHQFPQERGLLMWLRFVFEAERNTRYKNRAIVRYEDLLAAPQVEMQRLEEELGVRWPDQSPARVEKLRNWIDASLDHQGSVVDGPKASEGPLIDLCLEVYSLLQPAVLHLDFERLDAIWHRCAIFESCCFYTVAEGSNSGDKTEASFTVVLRDPFNGQDMSGGWRYHPKLGFYNIDQYPWINHAKLGFIYVEAAGPNLYLYVGENGANETGWLFTSRRLLPQFYSFSKGAWLNYDGEMSFNDYFTLGNGWYYHSGLGFCNFSNYPWIYHSDLGFIYVDETKADFYLHAGWSKSGGLGWLYTNRTLFPDVFCFSKDSWLRYAAGSSFFNLTAKTFESC